LAARLSVLALLLVVLTLTAHARASSAERGNPPGGQDDQVVDITLKHADIALALNALSRKTGCDLLLGPEVKGVVSSRTSPSPEAFLNLMLKGTGFGWQIRDGVLIVTEQQRLPDVLQQIEANERLLADLTGGPVSMGFVDVDLGVVSALCARKATGLTIKEEPDAPVGSVTCTFRDRNALRCLALVFAVQRPPVALPVKNGVLRIRSDVPPPPLQKRLE
jgi:hypothetical protein